MTKIERTLFASLLGISVAIGAACVAKADEPAAKPCYVGAGSVIRTNQTPGEPRVLQNGIEAGCRTVANGLNLGAFGRLDMGSGQRQGTIGATVGLGSAATGSAIYGLGGYQFDASAGTNSIAIQKGGVFVIGVGIEQKLSSDIAAYGELVKDIASVGAARNLDPLYSARVGLRYKF